MKRNGITSGSSSRSRALAGSQFQIPIRTGEGYSPCAHCFHLFRGAIFEVLPDGFVLEKCCKCEARRRIHVEHRGK